ncbi:MAG TPA: cytochrome P450 [Ktedonobacteraceae bacterium]|nr:cytochrome P450 [Ktedonobacteraceae bacterium]
MTCVFSMSLTLGAVLSGAKDGSPEAQAAWYREMHANQPIRYQPEYDLWEVFCYDDVQRVLTDYRTFSAEILVENFPETEGMNTDPPQHGHYRGLVSKAFTPRRVTQLIPRVASMVDEILEQGSTDGWIDIVEQLAYPLPVRVIGEMLGVPTEDKERFRIWSYQLFGFLPNQDNSELMNYFYDQLDQRAKEPSDDLMSALLAAEQDGARLTREEAAGMCVGLLAAGNVTTTLLLGLATRRFVKQPEVFQQIRHDPSLIPGVIEELLRYEFVGAYNMRVARCDTTIKGCEIKEGQVVMAWLSAANFDETHFPHAEQFDIRRSPNPHLTFGHGIHFCLGAPLARMEAKVALAGVSTGKERIDFREALCSMGEESLKELMEA